MKNKIDFFGIIVLISTIAFLASSCDIFKDNFEAPTGVVVTKLSNNAIHVTWNKVEDAINYTIAYRSNLDSADTRRDAGTSQITTFTHYYYVSTDVTTLYYYIKAHNLLYTWEEGYKVTGWSSPVSVNIK